MSLLFRRRPVESRALPATDVPVTDKTAVGACTDRALRIMPVYAAVSLVTEALVSVPLHAYRSSDAGARRVSPDPPLLVRPSSQVDPLTWRSQYVASMLLRGNAYGYAARVGADGNPAQIEWQHPDSVTVEVTGGRVRYTIGGREVDPGTVVHIRGVTLPGQVVGLSPVHLFRLQLGSAESAIALQSHIYESGGPAAHFKKTDRTLTPTESDTVKARFRAQIAAGDLLVTGSDWDYTQLGMTPADARFVEAAKLTATQIASIFHVPPEEIGGETGSSLTYSTLEMNDLKFIRRAVSPLAIRLEAALDAALPTPQYAKFNLDAYVRTDLMTRMQAHAIALKNGIETNDEVRALEDRPPLTDAQLAQWLSAYGSGESEARNIVEMAQKVYLGVGTLYTSDEARAMLNKAGADLPVPGPTFPARPAIQEGRRP